ncbi:MAG: hypothetical protein LBH70_06650 [Spirochaetaceae bacterium]|nr:hypothetical protein [Spirochaetaceae bacterium]
MPDIWKAAEDKLYMYIPNFSNFGGRGAGATPYSFSGSTLTLKTGDGDMKFTKQ